MMKRILSIIVTACVVIFTAAVVVFVMPQIDWLRKAKPTALPEPPKGLRIEPVTPVTIPYEKVLTVDAANRVDAESMASGKWKPRDSYVRAIVKDPEGKEQGIRIHAEFNPKRCIQQNYKGFVEMGKRCSRGEMLRIEENYGNKALEPGMNQSVWVMRDDGTNDLIVPAGRISRLHTTQIE